MQPILITRMKKLIAICCDCKLHFSPSIPQLVLVAKFIGDRNLHHVAVRYAIPDFMQSQTRGVPDPPSSLKDWGAVPLSRSSPGRVTRGGTGVLSRFVPPLVCPAFCPACFMQFYCITIHYIYTTRQPIRPSKSTQHGNQCAQNLIFYRYGGSCNGNQCAQNLIF